MVLSVSSALVAYLTSLTRKRRHCSCACRLRVNEVMSRTRGGLHSLRLRAKRKNTRQRDAHPVRAVVQLVDQLVKGFIQYEKLQQGGELGRIGRQEDGVAGNGPVFLQENLGG